MISRGGLSSSVASPQSPPSASLSLLTLQRPDYRWDGWEAGENVVSGTPVTYNGNGYKGEPDMTVQIFIPYGIIIL